MVATRQITVDEFEAMSLDGRVADREGRSVWITGEEARAEVHRLRAGFDVAFDPGDFL